MARPLGGVVLISNPSSGRNRRGLRRIDRIARRLGIEHRVPAHAEMADAVRAVQDAAVLVVNGGDGTVVDVVRVLVELEHPPVLALLGGGTTNLIHADIGLRGSTASALRAALDHAETPDSRRLAWRAPMCVRSNETERLGFFLGFAAFPAVIRLTRKQLHTKGFNGRIGEGLMLLRVLSRLITGRTNDPLLHSRRLVRQGSGPDEAKVVVAYATSLRKLVLGLMPPAGEGVAFLALSEHYRPRDLLLVLRGKTREPAVTAATAVEWTVEPDDEWVLDGDIHPPEGPLGIGLGKPLRFLVR